jgi:hypothetical protein
MQTKNHIIINITIIEAVYIVDQLRIFLLFVWS